jgi:hypothetical protein
MSVTNLPINACSLASSTACPPLTMILLIDAAS